VTAQLAVFANAATIVLVNLATAKPHANANLEEIAFAVTTVNAQLQKQLLEHVAQAKQ